MEVEEMEELAMAPTPVHPQARAPHVHPPVLHPALHPANSAANSAASPPPARRLLSPPAFPARVSSRANPMDPSPINIAFVCWGNICRSPMAEAVFRDTARRLGVAHRFGTIRLYGCASINRGKPADARTVHVCAQHDIEVDTVAEQIPMAAFDQFDYILAVDEPNLWRLQGLAPRGCRARVAIFGRWDPDGDDTDIDDPFRSDGVGEFERVFAQVSSFLQGFIRDVVFREGKPRL